MNPYRYGLVRSNPPRRRTAPPTWIVDVFGILITLWGLPSARRARQKALADLAEKERRYLDQIGFCRAFEIVFSLHGGADIIPADEVRRLAVRNRLPARTGDELSEGS